MPTHGEDGSGIVLPPGPSLVHLPEAVVFQFLRIARSVICKRFVPIIWLRFAIRRRDRRLSRRPIFADRLAGERACETALVDASEYIRTAGISDLAYLLSRKSIPLTFQAGDIICHERESASVGIVTILQGKIDLFEIIYRDKSSTNFYELQPGMSAVTASLKASRSTANAQMLDEESSPHHEDDAAEHSDETLDFRSEQHPSHLRYCKLKKKGLTNTRYLRTVEAPYVMGDISLFNNEPRMYYAVAATLTVDAVMIPRSASLAIFQAIPNPAVALRVLAVAHAVRTANMSRAFPLTTNRLRQSPLFYRLTEDELQLVLICARPKVFPKGAVLVDRNRPCPFIFFVRRGVVEEAKERGNHSSSVALWEGATFGEREAFFKERSDAQYIASTNADVYMVPMEDLQRLCSRSETFRARLAEGSQLLRMIDPHDDALRSGGRDLNFPSTTKLTSPTTTIPTSELSPAAASSTTTAPASPTTTTTGTHRYVDLMSQIPLWRALDFPTSLFDYLRPLWRPCLYSRGDYVFRKSDYCSDMIILLRGRVKIMEVPDSLSSGAVFQLGECVGYTCLLQHRWQYSAVATEVSEAILLSHQALADALAHYDRGLPLDDLLMSPLDSVESPAPSSTNRRLLTRLIHACIQLMHPLLRRPAGFFLCQGLTQVTRRTPNPNSFAALATVNLHPTSLDEQVMRFHPYSHSDGAPFAPDKKRRGNGLPLSPQKNSWRDASTETKSNAAREAFQAELVTLQQKSAMSRGASILVTEDAMTSSGSGPRRRPSVGNMLRSIEGTAVRKSLPGSPKGDDDAPTPSILHLPGQHEPRIRTPNPTFIAVDEVGNLPPPAPLPIREPAVVSTTLNGKAPAAKVPHLPLESQDSSDQGGDLMTEVSLFDVDPLSGLPDGYPLDSPRQASQRAASPSALLRSPNAGASKRQQQQEREPSTSTGGRGETTTRTPNKFLSTPTESHLSSEVGNRIDLVQGSWNQERLEEIMKPLQPKTKRDSIVPQQCNEKEAHVPAPPAPPSQDANGRKQKHQRHRHGQILPAKLTPVTPRAHKTLTYSASERYGSLMEAMRRSMSPRSTTTEGSETEDDVETGASKRATVEKGKPQQEPYMWLSSSVAAPLLASRPQSASLCGRIAEVHRRINAQSAERQLRHSKHETTPHK